MARSDVVAVLGIACLWLAACAPKPEPTAAVVAPRPLAYTCEFEERLLFEYASSPGDSATRKMVDDYRRERKQLAAIHKIDLHCVP